VGRGKASITKTINYNLGFSWVCPWWPFKRATDQGTNTDYVAVLNGFLTSEVQDSKPKHAIDIIKRLSFTFTAKHYANGKNTT